MKTKDIILWTLVMIFVCAFLWTNTNLYKAQRGDLNSDGLVDIKDLSILSNNWSK